MARRRTAAAVFALLAASLAGDAASGRTLAPPGGELTLDIADPILTVTIAGIALRLRVDLDQREVVELNRTAVARLPLKFEAGPTDAIGRVDVPSVIAAATFTLNDRPVAVTLASHGECCVGADGTIGPDKLPYALVRLVRGGKPAGAVRTFAMTADGHGLTMREPIGSETLRIGFSLARQETLATAAAGSVLSQAQGGRFEGSYGPAPIAFGIARPVRTIRLARPALLAGFRFDRIVTRTADYGGRYELPHDAAVPGDIVVAKRLAAQRAWPGVLIGRDRLDRCSEIVFQPAALLLTMRCDFGG